MTFAADFDRISITGVCYDYGRRRVLSRVSLASEAATITGILGPNGAGKSTLMSVVSTRARPSQGRVEYGTLAADTPQALLRARIGWLGHDPGFYPELTARENLTFYARLHGVADVDAVVGVALDHAGLAARADDAVGGFSRGMRQRLGLERVLLHRPRLVLLDEPFTGLDDASAGALLDRLSGLRRDRCIVWLSTHDLDLVSSLLDRAIVLRAGRIVDDFTLTTTRTRDDDVNTEPTPALVERYRRAVVPEAGESARGAVAVAPRPATQDGSPRVERAASARATGTAAVASPRATQAVAPNAPQAADAHLDTPRALAPAADSLGSELARFGRAVALIVRKDLIVELRSRELLLTTLFFAVSCVLVFAFALVREGRPMADAAAGILWIAISFSAALALGRTFEREQAHHTLQALLQAPVERGAIYIGKLLGLLVLLLMVEVIVVPLVALFFQAALIATPLYVAAFVIAGTVGLLAVGTMFSAMLVRTRSRDVLLPVLLYPMTVPVLLAGVRGTSAVIQATPDLPSARAWLAMLVFFNAVFLSLALWTFDAVTSE